MTVSARFSLLLLFLLSSLLHTSFSADPRQISPSPSPSSPDLLPASTSSPSPLVSPSPSPSPAPEPAHAPSTSLSPSPSPSPASEPAHAPSSPSPAPEPAYAPSTYLSPSPSPSPAPEPGHGVSYTGVGDEEGTRDRSSGGMNAGQKAGVALGVIAATGVVVFALFVFRKRQQNIRRAHYA
ncbi:hypothetical protein QN277_008125 [Acacia crassicarpa]|uniref:Uncharacterized protein n=1 Tax=Acacia crassicarpa TaxID=499986 RepID=A0AAE1JP48_9FABA|nr:hypothetical protein QN277_008125 [Acacia crassicarpa]